MGRVRGSEHRGVEAIDQALVEGLSRFLDLRLQLAVLRLHRVRRRVVERVPDSLLFVFAPRS